MKREHKIYSFDHIGQMHAVIWAPEKQEGPLPLVLFLNGAGERGADPKVLAQQALPKYLEQGMELPFVVACPQCPTGITWENVLFELDAVLEDVLTRYDIDRSRISLTGISMGGFGTWSYAITRPRKFFRMAPVCGGGMSWRCAALKDIPVWAFHGGADDDVPPVYSQLMVDAVNKNGGDAKLTLYPGVDHFSWDRAYLKSNLLDWLCGKSDRRDEKETF